MIEEQEGLPVTYHLARERFEQSGTKNAKNSVAFWLA